MKTRSLLFALAIMLFGAVSCTSETAETKVPEVTLDTRGVKEEAPKEAPANHVTGKWQNGNTWVNLKIDGTFEASFNGATTVVGNWTLSSDEKTLKLSEGKATEGKGQAFNKEFTVVELSDAVMRVEDAEGNKLELKAE